MSDEAKAHSDDRSFLARAARTPVRDLVRFRISGRLDLNRLLAESQLPQTLANLILRTVRATRLWRLEKVDVAKELIAHFADGLRAGHSPEKLASEFGDPDRAAKLIRRAKKRNRPVWWKGVRYSMYGILCLLAIYSVLIVHFALGRPNVAHDYVIDINARAAAVPADERAWPLYREALLALEPMPDELREHWPDFADEHWPKVAAYLEANHEAILLIREASQRRGMGLIVGYGVAAEDQKLWSIEEPGSSEFGLIGVLLPHLSSMRDVARVLSTDAHRAAREGDREAVVANLTAMLRLAPHVKEHPVMISDLVSMAIYSLAFRAIGVHLADHADLFNDEDLVALAHVITTAADDRALRIQFEGERMFFADFLQRVFTDDGRGGGRFAPQGFKHAIMVNSIAGAGDGATGMLFGPLDDDTPMPAEAAQLLAGPAASFLIGNRREQMAKYDEFYALLHAEAATPLWLRTRAQSADRQIDDLMGAGFRTQVRYLPVAVLMPAIGTASVRAELVAQQRDAMLTAIALELYRRHHGHWPDFLDDLVPRYLPAVPIDRHDGQPLRYTLVDDRPLVYSVGTNREDNGGRMAVDPRTGEPSADAAMRWWPIERIEQAQRDDDALRRDSLPDGDWILWPTEQ